MSSPPVFFRSLSNFVLIVLDYAMECYIISLLLLLLLLLLFNQTIYKRYLYYLLVNLHTIYY